MKLLLVDDEKHVITALRRLIPAERFHIDEILYTQSYEEAKVLLEKERPEIAIVDILLAPTLRGQLRDAVPVGVEIVRSPNRIVREGRPLERFCKSRGLSKKS